MMLDEKYPDRQYWQKMNLAMTLEKNSKCDCCQCLIQNHTIVELQTCLQELSKWNTTSRLKSEDKN